MGLDPTVRRLFETARGHHRAGDLSRAEALYREVLAAQPDHADALHMLGLAALQAGRFPTARAHLASSIALAPRLAEAHNHLGLTLQALRQPDAAEAAFRQALALKRRFAPAWLNLGNLMALTSRPAEAAEAYRHALAVEPRNAAAHANFAKLLAASGKPADAEAHYRAALRSAPDAAIHTALAALLHRDGRPAEAVEHYRQASALAPRSATAAMNLAIGLRDAGRAREAAHAAATAHTLAPGDPAVRSLLADCLMVLEPTGDDTTLAAYLTRALAEGWARPQLLAPAALGLLRADPDPKGLFALEGVAEPDAALADWLRRDTALPGPLTMLLFVVLGAAVIADRATERFLSALRRSALRLCATGATVGTLGLGLLCGLADQAWLTEYAWAETDAEAAELAALEQRTAAARAGGGGPAPEWLAVLASYRGLGALPDAGALLDLSWPAALARCLTRQIAEPAQEAVLQAGLPRLTVIRDATSESVRAQYEANPYPRWTGSVLDLPSAGVHAVLRGALPGLVLDGDGPPAPEILVAGCGTGQHPIETARRFANSRVLAVDLSLASLGYAARKTREAGIATITYAQADIVELGALERRFDVIEAMGVLHHLEDPERGWRALSGLLRPGGFMKLGLYSAAARAPIARARAQIASGGYGRSPAEIRRFRRDMPALLDPEAVANLLASPDFYSISGCRDLLFHACEHPFTLPRIARALDALDLRFLGFELPAAVGPQGAARRDLAAWDAFERDHPDAFRAMYQFWVRAVGA